MKTILFNLLLLSIAISGVAQEKKLLRKAAIATDRMNYEEALKYYDQALQKNPKSYRANAGKGMLLAEFVERYDQALPHLEIALQHSPEDTLVRIFYTLGKSYHYIGDYDEALHYYKKAEPYDKIGEEEFHVFIKKRIADCKYALANSAKAPPKEQYIVNLGNTINSEMPEYSSIYTQDKELIFTSKRKDDEKEKKNAWDGKFFESMYISTLEDGKYSTPRRYTLPDKNGDSKFPKHNEAVISASPDTSLMFLYRQGKIYQSVINEKNAKADKLGKKINFSPYQNHACLSPDGNTLFFTSESKKGIGGTDIYRSEKSAEGKWSEPLILDSTINTLFDEASPFMSEDGTLYFSSNGLPGFGGFDVYKTRFVNEHWTQPENLGQPINSPANDLFFTLDINTTAGHYSSNRLGGYGDMDVYRVNYSVNEKPDCDKTDDPLLAINFIPDPNKSMTYTVELKLPENYSGKFTSTTWKLNDSLIRHTSMRFPYTFTHPGSYVFEAKVVTGCDTCVEIFTACRSNRLVIYDTEILALSPKIKNQTDSISEENQNQELSDITMEVVYFDYNSSEINTDAGNSLKKNIEILKNNKNLTVTLSGNTDSRGLSEYNRDLSLKRANSVKNHLIQKGIAKNRIVGIYPLGESSLANHCSNGVECSEEEHRENRRTEFKVFIKSTGQNAATTYIPMK